MEQPRPRTVCSPTTPLTPLVAILRFPALCTALLLPLPPDLPPPDACRLQVRPGPAWRGFPRAVAACRPPVLTGIGHEVDTSVADQVAHRAYKTPTAAAGALIEAVTLCRQETEECAARLGRASTRARR